MADIYALIDEGQQALDAGQVEDALRLAAQAVALDPAEPEAIFLQAEAMLEIADFRGAEGAYRRLDALAPGEPAVLSGLGLCLFETARFDEAEERLLASLELEEAQAEVHHTLGQILERREEAGAEQRFARAHELDPEAYPEPIFMSEEEFDTCVESALDELPEKVQGALDNVNFAVEDLPSTEDLTASDPPLSPSLLGLWRGASLAEKTFFDPWTEWPGDIVLYQKNLQRMAASKEDLIAQIRITVLHEVGHALGLTEDDLDDRGLR